MESLHDHKGYKVTRYDGHKYVRVFHHNSTNKQFFNKTSKVKFNEISFINEIDKFSVLGSINYLFHIDGKYNFIFHNPDTYPNLLLVFNQSSHPLYSSSISDLQYKFVNSENINILDAGERKFRGLIIDDSENSFIDGCDTDNHWWYAIGVRKPYIKDNMIPGIPIYKNEEWIPTTTNDLYIRVDDFDLFRYLPNLIGYKTVNCICPIHTDYNYLIFIIFEI